MTTSDIALKEWAIVVDALASGEQLILVRKGGIRDPKGSFQLEHREFFLYPTMEHQNEEAIRPEFRERLSLISQRADPSTVPLKVYGGVAFCGQMRDPADLAELTRYHVWTPEFFEQRVKYRPQSPTLVVVLRAYLLKEEVSHPVKPEYAGCKSWVPLSGPISLEGAQPIVENRRFREALEQITARLG